MSKNYHNLERFYSWISVMVGVMSLPCLWCWPMSPSSSLESATLLGGTFLECVLSSHGDSFRASPPHRLSPCLPGQNVLGSVVNYIRRWEVFIYFVLSYFFEERVNEGHSLSISIPQMAKWYFTFSEKANLHKSHNSCGFLDFYASLQPEKIPVFCILFFFPVSAL